MLLCFKHVTFFLNYWVFGFVHLYKRTEYVFYVYFRIKSLIHDQIYWLVCSLSLLFNTRWHSDPYTTWLPTVWTPTVDLSSLTHTAVLPCDPQVWTVPPEVSPEHHLVFKWIINMEAGLILLTKIFYFMSFSPVRSHQQRWPWRDSVDLDLYAGGSSGQSR